MNRMTIAGFAGSNRHYSHHSFAEFLAVQRRLGLKRIELWGGMPHVWCDHLGNCNLTTIKASLAGSGTTPAAFSPEPYGYSLFAAPRSALRNATLKYYVQCISYASALHIPLLCLTPFGACCDSDYSLQWEFCRGILAKLCDEARVHDMKIALGISTKDESPILISLIELKRMLEAVDAPNLGVVLDTWPMSAAGETIGQWFTAFDRAILHVRFTDARNDGPHIWSEGCLPCRPYFDELLGQEYRGVVSLGFPGERYKVDPENADCRNLEALRGVLPAEAWV